MAFESEKSKILLVEDETAIAETIVFTLEREGFQVKWVKEGAFALSEVAREKYDLIILDIGLPDINGIEVCREVRKSHTLPIFFLTARNEELDRILGFEIGGDDYIAKPFSPRELAARVRALFRRVSASSSKNDSASKYPFELDGERAKIRFEKADLSLTKTEFLILKLLISRPGRVFSREEIMSRISDHPDMSLERTIDSHVKSLRGKIREKTTDDWLVTHRGFGYALKEKAE
jgi:two-component system catabolic regulation response regulator CreB